MARSNLAKASKVWVINRPAAVVVSTASVSDRGLFLKYQIAPRRGQRGELGSQVLVIAAGGPRMGEIGIVAVAVANAIHHATGKRVRSLPITVDKLLAA